MSQQSALRHWSKNINNIKGTQEYLIIEQNVYSGSTRKWSKELETKI